MKLSELRLLKHSEDLFKTLGLKPETEIEAYEFRILQGHPYSTYLYRILGSNNALQIDYVYDESYRIVQKGLIIQDFFSTQKRIEKYAAESASKYGISFSLAVAVGGFDMDVKFFLDDCEERLNPDKKQFIKELSSSKNFFQKRAIKKCLDFDPELPCWLDNLSRRQLDCVGKYIANKLEALG